MGMGQFRDINPNIVRQIEALDTAHLPAVPLPPQIIRLEVLIKSIQTGPTLPKEDRIELVEAINRQLDTTGFRLRLEDGTFGVLAFRNGSIQIRRNSRGSCGFKRAKFSLALYDPSAQTRPVSS
jgi:hypothetical protein